ncbi:MAG: Na/Pi cotransporter family protein [Alphaproteobacteria bacterium]
MVRRAFLKGFGARLKRIVRVGTKNRFSSFFSGIFVTFFLQSSTATILMISSFAKTGMIGTFAALSVVIGADLSTTLVAKVLALDLSLLSPILLIAGFLTYSEAQKSGPRNQIAFALVGLGLMLLSLTLLRQSIAPLNESETLPMILAPLQYDPIIAVLIGAIITWIMHSSLAAILLFSSVAATAALQTELGLYLVLGANLGGAIIPLALLSKENTAVRRITIGNLIMRVSIIALLFPFSHMIVEAISAFDIPPEHALINLHVAFNILLALIFLPLVSLVTYATEKLVPEKPAVQTPYTAQFLDEKSLDTPIVALAGAARETLRMAEYVQDMFKQSIIAIQNNDLQKVKAIRQKDDIVDKIYKNIKLYMINLSREALSQGEADRYVQILTFSTNLEYVGDIIDKNLMEIAEKKIKKQENFSDEGFREIQDFHKIILQNMQLAQNIFLLQDPELARQLVEEKKNVRDAVKETSDNHFQRLSEGLASSHATSTMHMDIIRDFRRINTYMTAVAYSILEQDQKKNAPGS